MYIIRDIFQLQFGHYREAKALFNEVNDMGLLPKSTSTRVLSDFTGDSYRLVFEQGFDTLSAYEESLNSSMNEKEWKAWYEKFKPHVKSSHREILKQVI